MTADDDRRWRDGVNAAVAALQAGERHSIEDREMIRREIRDSERRIVERIANVDAECKAFRRDVRKEWEQTREEQEQREKDGRDGKRSVTVAWIGGGMLLLVSLLNTGASLLGGH